MRIDDLRENIDFVVYAVGIDLEANRLSEVARLPFKTNYAEYIDCSFDVKTSVDGLNIHVEVTPSDPDAYWYYGIRETSRYEAAVYPFANVELFVADEASTVISGARLKIPMRHSRNWPRV